MERPLTTRPPTTPVLVTRQALISRADIQAMFEGVDDATREIVVRKIRTLFSAAIAAVNAGPMGVLAPPAPMIMSPFRYTPMELWRGMIIGQDPFPTVGRAHGLAFSTQDGSVPPSTLNMYRCLVEQGHMNTIPKHGDLTKWARQGVLMINCAMTTLIGKSNVHAAAWSDYTDALIKSIATCGRPMFFILLGNFAQKKADLIPRGHCVIKWCHPSPLSAANQSPGPKNFVNADIFDRANDFLLDRGDKPIDWDINTPLPADYVAPVPVVDTAVVSVVNAPVVPDDLAFVEANVAEANIGSFANQMPAARWNDLRDCTDDDPTLPSGPSTVYVFTDGAAIANGKPNCRASWGFYITDGTTCAEIHGEVAPIDIPGELFHTSNNRGELEAIIRALEFVHAHLGELAPSRECAARSASKLSTRVVVVSDSEYALNCVNSWVNGWIADPSKLAGKKNLDLIFAAKSELDAIKSSCDVAVQFAHVRSHCMEPPGAPTTKSAPSLAWFAWKCNGIADQLCAQVLGVTDNPPIQRRVAVEPRVL